MATHQDITSVPDCEAWAPIPSYEGFYEASRSGLIRRVAYYATTWVGRIIRPSVNHHGYLAIGLGMKGVRRRHFVHRLIAETYLEPQPSPKHQINHKDGNKLNNSVENLEWVTPSENHWHASRNGLKAMGSGHGVSKLNEDQAREILSVKGIEKQRDTAKRFGISQKIVCKIQRRELWKHI